MDLEQFKQGIEDINKSGYRTCFVHFYSGAVVPLRCPLIVEGEGFKVKVRSEGSLSFFSVLDVISLGSTQ